MLFTLFISIMRSFYLENKRLDEIIYRNLHFTLLEQSRPKKTLKQFFEEANAVHHNKYDYSQVDYQGTDIKVKIGCPIDDHGYFWQRPHDHLRGAGCPLCCESHLERDTYFALKNEGIIPKRQEPLGNQKLDFYLPSFNAAIECQGEQHYEPVWGEERLIKQIAWDNMKKDNCAKQNIRLFEIAYWDKTNVPQKVKEILDILRSEN